jgi:uncharacterized protein YgiM (DUF1202 family)
MQSNSIRQGALAPFAITILIIASLSGEALLCGQTVRPKPRIPTGGRVAIVVDERLSVLRTAPNVSAELVTRLSRGRFVAIIGTQRSKDGLTFYLVKVTRRRRGWIQSDAVVSTAHAADDKRLMQLIQGSEEFDRIARARIFLDAFPRSPLRPAVLLLYGDAAEEAAGKLSRDAVRRLNQGEMTAGRAPEFSYFMNFNELDRFNRQGVRFVFDSITRRFNYDGAAWREITRRCPQSLEAAMARERLKALTAGDRK